MTTKTDSREIALDVLLEILENGGMSHLVLNQALTKYRYLEKQDRAFITRTVEGTLEYVIQLDAVIDRFSSVKTERQKPLIRTLLRMSVYQIFYMERVPDPAVCNEAVKLAKKRRFAGLSGFVNAVLRSVAREKETIVFDDPTLRYSVPRWMFAMWEEEYGRETAERIAASFLTERPLTVRCNESRAATGAVTVGLREQGITVKPSELVPGVLELSGYDAPDSIRALADGLVTVQDAASALVGFAASPKSGDFVLDVCSSPGGKALHAADLLAKSGGEGIVEARDLTKAKVAMIDENIARCGFSNIRTKVWDATVFDASLEGKADIVLADLPCSGLGIIGKKPDIKRRLRKEDIPALAGLQREILNTVSRYVKPGGVLVYSTCTITRAENEENADWILDGLPFEERDIASLLPEGLRGSCNGREKAGRIKLLPGIHPCDGFFIAAFTRKK